MPTKPRRRAPPVAASAPAGAARVRRRQLELISGVTDRLVRSLDFREALRGLVDGATELLGVERGSILILDHETRTLRIEVAKALSPAIVARTRIPLGQGIAGRVAATGEPIVARDVRELPDWNATAARRRRSSYEDASALCVPLVLQGRVLGVMTFNQKASRKPFDDGDLEFALLIANQAAIVLWSAQLHREFLEKQILDRELGIARTIQERLAPQSVPEVPGFRFAATSVMCQEVGGDYYDFMQLAGDRVALVVGDAAGHGLGSALVAAEARAALRECLLREDEIESTLARVNDRLQVDTTPEMYMTLLLGFLETEKRRLRFATAGHHMPLVVRQGEVVRLAAVGSNIPLGIRRGLHFVLEESVALGHGDLVLFFTDGLWEAADEAGHRFGTAGIERVLARRWRAGEEEILAALLEAVAAHAGQHALEDDCTLLLLRCV
jgi:sigma-B regulation protein RsbU (phosphoserine phosphatase)